MEYKQNKMCYMVKERYEYLIIVVCKTINGKLLFEDYNGFGYYDFNEYRSKVYDTVEEALEVLRSNLKNQIKNGFKRKRIFKMSVSF